MAKSYSSVEEMVRDVSEVPEVSAAIQKRLAQREIVSRVFALRSAKGLSQKDIADHMKCSQSRISKLENGTDEELSIGELAGYLNALGMELGVVVRKKGATLSDEVKYHAFSIHRIMDKLTNMAGSDGEIARGVFSFIRDAASNLERLLNGAAAKLMPIVSADAAAQRISIEVECNDESTDDSEHCDHCGAAS